MRDFLNQPAHDLKQGGIREFFDKAKKYTNTINMGIGEPDADTPRPIIDAGFAAMLSGKTHYTPNAGELAVREQVAAYLADFGVKADPVREIIMTCGGMGAVAMGLLCTVNLGDEVLIQDPQWLNYRSQIQFAGGVAVPVPVYAENNFSLKAADIEARLTDHSRILMLNSPNNPTGAVMSPADLQEIAALAQRRDLLVFSDEVYCELLYDGLRHHSIAALDGMQERTVVINSFSKSFSMTGWRVGFAAGPSELIAKMTVLQENLVACAPAFAQHAAQYALESRCQLEQMREIYQVRRNILVAGLNKISGIQCAKPQGAFYAFPDIRGLGLSSAELANKLLEAAGVVTIPGSCFGKNGEGFLRLAYANSEENIQEALRRIHACLI